MGTAVSRPRALTKVASSLVLLLMSSLASQTQAQLAEQVADLLTEERTFGNSSPEGFTRLGNLVVFFANNPSTGFELWTSDGTGPGTSMLADACLGNCGSFTDSLQTIGNKVFWLNQRADLSGDGITVWRSDGTKSGTFPLSPSLKTPFMQPGLLRSPDGALLFFGETAQDRWALWRIEETASQVSQISDFGSIASPVRPSNLTLLAERLYFFFNGDIWSTDGTSSGTRNEFDLQDFPFLGKELWAAGDRLLFTAREVEGNATNTTIWSFDSITQELVPVKTFPAGSPESFLCAGNTDSDPRHLYFQATNSTGGTDLWRTAGTAASTHALASFGGSEPFDACPSSLNVQSFDRTIAFLARQEGTLKLYRSNGTPASVTPLLQICENPGFCGTDGRMTRVEETVLLTAWDSRVGRELWTTDATEAGTRVLKDLCPGPCDGAPDLPLEVEGDSLFFARDSEAFALWQTDGTEAGTKKLARLPEPPLTPFPNQPSIGRLEDTYFFAASDASHGTEPWITNGDEDGTRILLDIHAGNRGSRPAHILPLDDGVVFVATNVDEVQERLQERLWNSRGSESSTTPLTDLSGTQTFSSPSVSEGLAFFPRLGPQQTLQLWRSDGTAAGTFDLRSFEAGSDQPIGVTTTFGLEGKIYFMVDSPNEGGLWVTEGTTESTVLVVPQVELGASAHELLGEVEGLLYFHTFIDTPEASTGKLFASDGSPEGTRLLTSTNPVDRPKGFVHLDGQTYFLEGDCARGQQLFRTDGTMQGTNPLSIGPIFGCSNRFGKIVVHGDALFFFEKAADGTGPFLWRSDGTGPGTRPIAEFTASPFLERNLNLTSTSLGLFFTPEDHTVGKELWISDGTGAGTRLLKDIHPGTASSEILGLKSVGEKVYFSANNGIHGSELWASDGTEEGTRIVQDIFPGGPSSRPGEFTQAGEQLFFSADDGLSGHELWVLPLNQIGPPCRASDTALCLRDGRFKVEMNWLDFQDQGGLGQAVSLTQDTGYFWTFDEQNVEVTLKVLDGLGVNGHYWTFYGALSNIEYWLTVTDAETGLSRRYFNPARQFGSVGDTTSFGPQGATLRQAPEPLTPAPAAQPLVLYDQLPETALGEGCSPSEVRLCLNEGRFAVEATWADFSGNTGIGQAVNLTDDTGYFWFFNDQNVETVLKVLDGRINNSAYWVFYGSLSNVDFDLTVTDTQTGAVRTYQNRGRQFASVGDTEAFPQP